MIESIMFRPVILHLITKRILCKPLRNCLQSIPMYLCSVNKRVNNTILRLAMSK